MLKLTGVVPPSGWYRSHCGKTNPRITPHARRRYVRYSEPRASTRESGHCAMGQAERGVRSAGCFALLIGSLFHLRLASYVLRVRIPPIKNTYPMASPRASRVDRGEGVLPCNDAACSQLPPYCMVQAPAPGPRAIDSAGAAPTAVPPLRAQRPSQRRGPLSCQ